MSIHAHAGTAQRSRPPSPSTSTPVPPPGTTLLSEPVDLLTLAVPVGWTSLSSAPLVLPGLLRQLGSTDAQLAGLLKGEAAAAAEGAIRLFAYTSSPALAYAAILSYSSPGTAPITAASAAAFSSFNRHTATVVIETATVDLPAGLGLRLRAVAVQGGIHLAYENLALLSGGRTIVLQVAADVTDLSFPAVFSQIESSIRFG